jgi:hypothetical protein
VSPITPPFGLVQKRYSENVDLRFLLSDDNYFSAIATCGSISATIWRRGGISITWLCRICITAPSTMVTRTILITAALLAMTCAGTLGITYILTALIGVLH